eukprot:CAMPEP_0118925636 /NCGR_PEP_ID=MMETSP1169-20130426/3491_1 /TAXON_ID=36882 /ORGANISM="Pyramimonas obovata, Strain CCMP722" /LENGTH=269 /DNA_ID=CAMNT_0006866985 /DNA_START=91 /DNA_END=900 /DNA_ORIENTATION=+
MDCKKTGKPHTLGSRARTYAFVPVWPERARELLVKLDTQQDPWVHPRLNIAYATNTHVLLAPPAQFPEDPTESMFVCSTGYQRKGMTSWALVHRRDMKGKHNEVSSSMHAITAVGASTRCGRRATEHSSDAKHNENTTSHSVREEKAYHQVRHDVSASRFVIDLGAHKRKRNDPAQASGENQGEPEAEAYLAYTVDEEARALDVYHTWTPSSARGRGLAARLCDAAITYAMQTGLQVLPSCSYVRHTYLPKKRMENAPIIITPISKATH